MEVDKSNLKVNKMDLFKNRNDKFERMTVTAPEPNDTIAIDLMFFSHEYNREIPKDKPIIVMNAVDVFSRKVASVKISSKSKHSILKGLDDIFEQFSARPKRIWTDKESGLYALEKKLNDNNIQLVTTENGYNGSNSVSLVENFNKCFRWYFNNKTNGPIHNRINKTINTYVKHKNTVPHSTTGFIPNEINDGKNQKEAEVEQALRASEPKKEPVKKYNVGDLVHIQRVKKTIKRKTDANFEKTISTVIAVLDTNPTTYLLDTKGKTRFYGSQLKPYIYHPNNNYNNIENDDTEIESEEEKEDKENYIPIGKRIKDLRRNKEIE
eukprot:PhM_4_TR2094/c3_g1_i1/m.20479